MSRRRAECYRGGMVSLAFVLLCCFLFLMTPVEQTFDYTQWYPNVIGIWSDSEKSLLTTPYLPHVEECLAEEVDISGVRGVFQYAYFHWSGKMDKAFKALPDSKDTVYDKKVWECAAFCQPVVNPNASLILVHYKPMDKAQNTWYLMEVEEGNDKTPLILARSKHKKHLSLKVPFVEGDMRKQGKEASEVPLFLVCGWHLLSFDTNLKIGVWVSIGVVLLTLFVRCVSSMQDENDSDDD